jgi:hypothetical protein
MDFYEEASLVMVPSGYKDQKVYSSVPDDGSGDLTFTRASNATRVGPDGLIEKVRTNVTTYSQDFTNWTKSNVTITTSATANPLDGSLDSQDITPTATLGVHRVLKTNSGGLNSINTWSVYAKAKGYNFLFLVENGNTGSNVSFNLSTGEVGQENSAVGQIESLGSGWYRCSMIVTTTTTPRFDIYVSPTDSLSAYTADGTSGVTLFGAQAEVSDFGPTPYIATTSAAVSVGPVANLPRLDYLGSSSPRLLLEPQTTAITTYSEQIDEWGKQNASVTANNTASPSGYVDADKIVEDTANSTHFVSNNFTASTATSHTFSVFAKMGERKYLCFAGSNVGAFSATYDLEAGTVVGATAATASIEDYGNGWYRCVAVKVIASGGGVAVRIGTGTTATVAASGFTQSYLGDGTSGLFIWGVNVTATSYVQSYVPTLGAAVTRGADSCSKTSATALIGQVEGTLFAEFEINANDTNLLNRIFIVSDGTLTSRVLILANTDETFRFVVSVAGSSVVNITTSTSVLGGRHKVAFAYKASDYVAYVDGIQVGSNTAVSSVPASLTAAYVGTVEGGASAQVLEGTVSQALIFKTRLSNADLATLTTL